MTPPIYHCKMNARFAILHMVELLNGDGLGLWTGLGLKGFEISSNDS